MTKPGGYAALLREDRMELFLDYLSTDRLFSEAVPEFDHSRNVPLICFISNGKTI